MTVILPIPLYSCTSIVADVLCPGTTVADEDPSPIAFPSSLYAVAVKLQLPGAASAFVQEGVLSLSSNETVKPSGAVPTTVYLTASGDTSEVIVLEVESFTDTLILPVRGALSVLPPLREKRRAMMVINTKLFFMMSLLLRYSVTVTVVFADMMMPVEESAAMHETSWLPDSVKDT